MTWIHQGKALYLASIGRVYGNPEEDFAIVHALMGEDWPALHEAVVSYVAPKMTVEGDAEETSLRPLRKCLQELKRHLETPQGTKDRYVIGARYED